MEKNLTSADIALLQLLIKTGPHTFPLMTDAADDRATLHAESLVSRGLIQRIAPLPGCGTGYDITQKGRFVFDRFLSAG